MAVIEKCNRDQKIRYLVRVRDSLGAWYPAQTFDRKVDADRYERLLECQKDQGSLAAPTEQRNIRVEGFLPRWSAECRTKVSEGWKQSQDQMARDYILPVLGKKKLIDVRPFDIGQLLGGLKNQGLSPAMQLHVYLLLNKIFKDAVEEYELLPNSPVRLKYRPKLQKRERPFLNPNDSWKLLNEVSPHWLGPAIWISVLAGLRPCEIQALPWSCVDFENKKILIRQSYKRKINRIEPSTKQGDWAEAPIPEPLEKYLLSLKADGRAISEFVAPGKFGGMLKYNILLNGLKRLCKKAEVKIITPHELRHSCSELYVQEGASAEDIRRLLNHSSLNVTQRYIHRTNERLDGIASKVQNVKPESPDRTTPPSRPNLRLIS